MMVFQSLLSSYDGAAAPAPAPAPARIPKKSKESRLSRDERKLREALERGAQQALSDAKRAVADRPPKKRIAVCFTIVDGLPHERCWRRWAAELEKRDVDVRFYAHAHRREKAQRSSAWLAERMIRDHYETRWGSIELVRATLALLDDALRDDPALVAFASETCVPIDVDAAAALASKPTTFLQCTCRPDNGYARERQWEKVDRVIEAAKVCKADQWVALSATHARACAALDACVRRAARAAGARDAPSLWRLLRRCTAADELLFPVSLALMGELRKPGGASMPGTARLAPERSADIEDRRLTYCDWSRGGTSPKTFDALTADVVRAARGAGCLFARKVAAAVDEATWAALVLPAKRGRDDDGGGDSSPKRARGAGASAAD